MPNYTVRCNCGVRHSVPKNLIQEMKTTEAGEVLIKFPCCKYCVVVGIAREYLSYHGVEPIYIRLPAEKDISLKGCILE